MSAIARARARPGVPQPGEVVAGKYEVQDVIGAGGMGVVVSARHLELEQTVAIKFLDRSLVDNPAASARFFREARAASRIRSEHVTRVIDVARTEQGTPYLVMEHMIGTDLERVQRAQGVLSIDDVLDYVLQACEALAEAHAVGVIHRDLKPSNLFLTHRADGSPLVKVLDFGISKIVEAGGAAPDGAETGASEMLGSPWYMSPEQVRSSMSVDARTDVWSLGVIMFQLLTGTHAFRSDTMGACLARIVADPPRPLRATRPEVPEGLERVVLACLEKDPEARLQSVAELAWSLSPFAPERARISIERVGRVLGNNPPGSLTPPLASFSAAAFAMPQGSPLARPLTGNTPAPSGFTPPPSGLTPPPPATTGQATGASVSTTTATSPPRTAPRWPIAVALVAALGIGAVAGPRLFSAPSRAGSASTSASVSVAATAVAPSPEPPASLPAATATASAPPPPSASASSSSAGTRTAPPSASSSPLKTPSAPATPRARPGKLKIDGPVETTL